jgi:hypothetical protein
VPKIVLTVMCIMSVIFLTAPDFLDIWRGHDDWISVCPSWVRKISSLMTEFSVMSFTSNLTYVSSDEL